MQMLTDLGTKLIEQSPAIAGMVLLAGGFLYFMWKMSSRGEKREEARDVLLQSIEDKCHQSFEQLAAKYDAALDQTTKKYEAALEKVVFALGQNTLVCQQITRSEPPAPRPP